MSAELVRYTHAIKFIHYYRRGGKNKLVRALMLSKWQIIDSDREQRRLGRRYEPLQTWQFQC